MTIHDFIPEKRRENFKWFIIFLQKFYAAYRAKKIICISYSTIDELKFFYGKKIYCKSKVIYNGRSQHFLANKKLERNKYDLLFVGSRARYKNFEKIIRLGRLLKKYNLNIVGGQKLKENEKNQLKKFWNGRWKYFGYVENEKLIELYNTCSVLLYTSSEEGFGIPIIEAFSCGCAVVISTAKACVEISGGKAEITNLSCKDFVEKIISASNYDQNIRKMLIDYSKNFSWNKTIKETYDFIKT